MSSKSEPELRLNLHIYLNDTCTSICAFFNPRHPCHDGDRYIYIKLTAFCLISMIIQHVYDNWSI